jgi:hypothetical protein
MGQFNAMKLGYYQIGLFGCWLSITWFVINSVDFIFVYSNDGN